MANTGLHLEASGSLSRPKTQSARTIRAWAHAREGFARTLMGGIVLALLTIGYFVALFLKVDAANNVLVVIGSGLGFLLGSGRENRVAGDE